MKTVHEVSELTGVSIRTLQYYDKIGLLPPSRRTEAEYRLYDDAALARLQQIMLFRELEFSLKDIMLILDSPDYLFREALEQQVQLLRLKRERIDGLIGFAREILTTGVDIMDFSAFDQKKINEYKQQAKDKWGKTAAYKEYEEKSGGRSAAAEKALGVAMMSIFKEFGEIKAKKPDCAEAQALVKKLQDYISANFYACSTPILASLGQMYAAGGEMTDNIDAAGGEGTAAFASDAIAVYCK